jgi:hypothetical protein
VLEAQALALLIPPAPRQDVDSAITYLGRRPMHAGTGSTLKKASRAQRIAARLRPLRGRPVRERVIGRTATHERVVEEVLHPTKGWRSNRHFTRKAA